MALTMTALGHITHAQAMLAKNYHMAWGDLPAGYPHIWGPTDPVPSSATQVRTATITKGAAGGKDTLPDSSIVNVIKVYRGATVYAVNTSWTLSGNQIDWAPAGAEPTVGQTYTVEYRYNSDAMTALIQEIGRREASLKSFAQLDVNGDISANNQNWSITATPTRHLYLQFKFGADEALNKTIYQLGLFTDTVPQAAVPPGQKYLLPAEIQNPGQLYMVDYIPPLVRVSGKREIFEFVLTY